MPWAISGCGSPSTSSISSAIATSGAKQVPATNTAVPAPTFSVSGSGASSWTSRAVAGGAAAWGVWTVTARPSVPCGHVDRRPVNHQRLYEYRFRDVDQHAREAVWSEIGPYVHRRLGSPDRVLDPAAGLCEFLNSVPAAERW